jgi:hypothetical protein
VRSLRVRLFVAARPRCARARERASGLPARVKGDTYGWLRCSHPQTRGLQAAPYGKPSTGLAIATRGFGCGERFWSRSKPKRLCPCSSGAEFCVYLPLAAHHWRRASRVLAPVPHGGARSLQHVPWPATAPVSAFCPHPLARPGADARCATHRCFPRRSAGAAGARSGGENSPRFEDDDTVHTVRHFVPGKSQGREGDSRSDRSTSCWRCTSSRLLGLSRGGAAPCRQRLQSTVEQ